jgi:hypothetical protein
MLGRSCAKRQQQQQQAASSSSIPDVGPTKFLGWLDITLARFETSFNAFYTLLMYPGTWDLCVVLVAFQKNKQHLWC